MPRLKLRALTISDLPQTLTWHNQEDIVDLYSGHPFPVNEEMEHKWYENILCSNVPTTVFGIEHISDQKLIGITILRDIDFVNRSAETAIYIGDHTLRGKGLSSEALKLALIFAFNKLGLNRVWLKVRIDNVVAFKLYRKTGFIQEGVLRQSVFKNGQFYDVLVLSVLKDEFEKLLNHNRIL